jgi:hypothetical protein
VAGGCDSAEQKADVRIQLTPAIAGIPINIPEITGGQGVRVGSASNDAKIVLNDSYISYMEDETDGQYVTDAFGRVEGVYWGSNVLTGYAGGPPDVALNPAGAAGGGSVTIHQGCFDTTDPNRWAGDQMFQYNEPDIISYRATLLDGSDRVAICGHQMQFSIARVDVMEPDPDSGEGAGKLVIYTTDPNTVAGDPSASSAEIHVVASLASFGQFDSPLTSDGAVSGAYATDFTANWLSPSMNVNEIFFQAEDLRTWKP